MSSFHGNSPLQVSSMRHGTGQKVNSAKTMEKKEIGRQLFEKP
jgi:hypothetical protein